MMRATLLFSCALFVACSSTSGGGTTTDAGTDTPPAACATDPRAQTYAPGMKQAGKNGKFTIELMSATPAPPARYQNDWNIHLTDASGAPVSGATFTVLPYMPDHGHPASTFPTVTAGTNAGDYVVNDLSLVMPGLWQITFTPKTTDGTTDQVVFTFCIPE